mgnify:CR=1 FL=1
MADAWFLLPLLSLLYLQSASADVLGKVICDHTLRKQSVSASATLFVF